MTELQLQLATLLYIFLVSEGRQLCLCHVSLSADYLIKTSLDGETGSQFMFISV